MILTWIFLFYNILELRSCAMLQHYHLLFVLFGYKRDVGLDVRLLLLYVLVLATLTGLLFPYDDLNENRDVFGVVRENENGLLARLPPLFGINSCEFIFSDDLDLLDDGCGILVPEENVERRWLEEGLCPWLLDEKEFKGLAISPEDNDFGMGIVKPNTGERISSFGTLACMSVVASPDRVCITGISILSDWESTVSELLRLLTMWLVWGVIGDPKLLL